MSRVTIKPSVYIDTEGVGFTTGYSCTMDTLLEERLGLHEKAHEITEAIIGIFLNDPLDGATEQIFGSVVALLELHNMKNVEVQ